jgi:uncharacterized protein YndB with AHSA1/START domain
MTTTVDLAIRASVRVSAPIASAFDVFTLEMSSWWPLETESIHARRGLGRPDGLHLEPWEGGRLYEYAGGDRQRWGSLLVWDPPRRIVLEWQTEPSRPPTEVAVTFTAEGDDTRVEVLHTGWEFVALSGVEAREARSHFAGEKGWGSLLDRYANAVGD